MARKKHVVKTDIDLASADNKEFEDRYVTDVIAQISYGGIQQRDRLTQEDFLNVKFCNF